MIDISNAEHLIKSSYSQFEDQISGGSLLLYRELGNAAARYLSDGVEHQLLSDGAAYFAVSVATYAASVDADYQFAKPILYSGFALSQKWRLAKYMETEAQMQVLIDECLSGFYQLLEQYRSGA